MIYQPIELTRQQKQLGVEYQRAEALFDFLKDLIVFLAAPGPARATVQPGAAQIVVSQRVDDLRNEMEEAGNPCVPAPRAFR